MTITKKIFISGDVQGVFFRQTALQKAEELQITGWIMNDPAGGVTAVAQGEKENVESFIEWCTQGPPAAQVNKIMVEDIEGEDYSRFEIKRQ